MKLYHVSTHPGLEQTEIGDEFVLEPGSQGAEGEGVYFSEQEEIRAADALQRGKKHTATIVIESGPVKNWYRSKRANLRKKNRPRTWHTKGKKMSCKVAKKRGKMLFCEYALLPK